jgi:hypothetical protein
MAYINENTGEYPRFIGDLQLLNPTATPDNLPDEWAVVVSTPQPEYQEGKNIYEGEPVKIDGVWTQQWVVRDMTTEELAQVEAQKQKVADFLKSLEDAKSDLVNEEAENPI